MSESNFVTAAAIAAHMSSGLRGSIENLSTTSGALLAEMGALRVFLQERIHFRQECVSWQRPALQSQDRCS